MLAIVGNKSDDYENQKVNDDEAKKLAKELDAIFQRTSAKQGTGIDKLFETLGKQYLNPEISITSNLTKEELIEQKKKIRIKEIKNSNKKKTKKCC